jgi:hypothetical protein
MDKLNQAIAMVKAESQRLEQQLKQLRLRRQSGDARNSFAQRGH